MFVTIQEAHRTVKPRTRPDDTPPAYAAELARQLSEHTTAEVRFDASSRSLYSTDASNYRQVPIGVVAPRTMGDVIATVAIAREFGAPILARGGGTSLAGQCCNVAVVLDFSKHLHHITELDPRQKFARVQPGIVLDRLRDAAEKYNLTFGPDPATHTHCTLGGMIGNNSCGTHALMAGKTSENIEELEVLTYDGLRLRVGQTSEEELQRIIREGGRRGEIYSKMRDLRDRYAELIRKRYPDIPRRVSGYNLDQLLPENGFHVARALVGTECTCVVVLEAKTRLVSSPPKRSLLVMAYPDIYQAADHVPAILPFKPIGLEAFDDLMIDNLRNRKMFLNSIAKLPDGKGWLLVEFGADTQEDADAQARQVAAHFGDKDGLQSKLFSDPADQRNIWAVREAALGATAVVPDQSHRWEGWEDSAVAPERLGEYLRKLRALYNEYGYKGSFYGHFGQGCLHTRIDFDFQTAEGIAKFRQFMVDASELVVSLGGSLSGEHGDGQARAELLPIMYGPELVQAFGEFKAIWDPGNKMNPGKVVNPYRIDEHLRLGADYHPPHVQTHFQFPADHGHFAEAAARCVGVGKCRRTDGGTMCPSYMVTGEEEHSTRGRARLLFEMMQGEVIKDGWKSEEMHQALDLCLACKGCKSDCPVQVDMATYKSEFLSHYYEGKRRPLHAYAVGWIYWWARLASLAPQLVNAAMENPVLSGIAKAVAGIAPERKIPKFATETFKNWFARQQPHNLNGTPVMLWPDTFTNYYNPQHGMAAVEVLEHLGYHVRVPRASLCCGRPLYDYGMLDTAKSMLRQILEALGPAIDQGMPLVGLEPSCVAVFRDELTNLFPNDARAKKLKEQSFTLAEFLDRQGDLTRLPKLDREAIVHGHCHHKAVMKLDADQKVMAALGLRYRVLDSGCCGMAGGFGFEKDHYQVSIACGERVLLPAVREAAPDALVIADGFSCETQIHQGTGKQAMHLAQVVQMAVSQERSPALRHTGLRAPLPIGTIGAVAALALGVGAGAAWAASRGRRR